MKWNLRVAPPSHLLLLFYLFSMIIICVYCILDVKASSNFTADRSSDSKDPAATTNSSSLRINDTNFNKMENSILQKLNRVKSKLETQPIWDRHLGPEDAKSMTKIYMREYYLKHMDKIKANIEYNRKRKLIFS